MPMTPLHRLLRRAIDVEADEVRATLFGFAWFFCLLGGYYLLRPLRDALGLAGGARELQWLFTGTFVAMLALEVVPMFALIKWRIAFKKNQPIDTSLSRRFARISHMEALLMVIIVIAATGMARGILLS